MINKNDVEESVIEYLKNLTILCIDDNDTTNILYEVMLKDVVKKIIFAHDGADGFEKFCNNHIDIIITDYQMPNMDGIEFTKKVREKNKDIPIILVSEIEDVDVIIEALAMNVTNFIRKPIVNSKVIELLIKTVKILMANEYIEDQKNKKMKELQDKERYNSYQEDLAFSKELNILRNDFYYQMLNSQKMHMVDFLYQPLDIVSGDAYSARCINDSSTFFLMVDGMGKGLSASLTAMIITTYINQIIDKMIKHNDFDLYRLVNEAIGYIQPILLEEEVLAIDFITIDNQQNNISYAKFAMPPMLLETNNNEVIKLKSNNSPISKFQNTFNISNYDITNISKFLIYTDGLIENSTNNGNQMYNDFIVEDFKKSFSRDDFKKSFESRIEQQEDDITFIYIHKLNNLKTDVIKSVFNTSLEDVDKANQWYSDFWNSMVDDMAVAYNKELIFTELYMNAYEHGNIGIDSKKKNQLLTNDTYYDKLLELEQECDKKISVEIHTINYNSSKYILTMITDEGDGFDTQILSKIFRNSKTFNGRGVFVSRKYSLGIYYNQKGTKVLVLNKV